MAKWTMEEVLRLALRHELDNFGEYNKASQETENPAIRAMFKFLADEERGSSFRIFLSHLYNCHYYFRDQLFLLRQQGLQKS